MSLRKAINLKKYLGAYLLILPSFIFLAIFTYYPILKSFWLSLFKYDLFSTPSPIFCNFSNYYNMFNTPLFWKVLRNNLWYGLGTVLPSVSLGLLFAVLFNNKRLRAKGFFRFSLFYPYLIPMATASMIWLWMFNPGYGIINLFLKKLSLPHNIEWVNDSRYALLAVIIVAIWKYIGFYMIIFLAGLQGIDEELYEAAIIEGANSLQKFRYITFPLLTPTTFFVTIIAVINSFQAIDQVFVMTYGGPYNSTNVLLFYIYENAFMYWNLGYASTVSFFLLVILLVATVIYFRYSGLWVHYER